jgi:hypothetical protein
MSTSTVHSLTSKTNANEIRNCNQRRQQRRRPNVVVPFRIHPKSEWGKCDDEKTPIGKYKFEAIKCGNSNWERESWNVREMILAFYMPLNTFPEN